MKKLMLLLFALLVTGAIHADDQITSALLDHVATVTQFKNGETKLALVDSVIQVGSIEGRSLFDFQLGFNGNTKPQAGEVSAANLVAGGYFKVSSLLWTKLVYPDQWKFLKALEHGVAYQYDFRDHHGFVCYQVGLAFGLQPK